MKKVKNKSESKFVSFKKLSKKEQKAINNQKRTSWATKPVTKVVLNKKKEESKRKCRKVFC